MRDDRFRQASESLEIWRDRRRGARTLASHRQEFRDFYQKLPDKNGIYYMFFSRGLLHWVTKALSFVPDDVNLVLLGTALPEDEQEWIRDTLGRPFHNVEMRINDKLAWTFLFDANDHNFGWLDIDCFVLNSDLFAEMRTVSDQDGVNGAWWYDTGYGYELSATYFQFFSVRAIQALRAEGVAHSPNCYSYRPVCCPPLDQHFYSEALTRRIRRQLLAVVPPDENGRPQPPAREAYFDTTVMPQLMARARGFGAGHVRDLRRLAWNHPGFEEISDELIHIGAVSYASVLSENYKPTRDPEIEMRYLLADNVALGTAEHLPAPYAQRRQVITDALAQAGMTPQVALDAARRHLIDERGLSGPAADRVIAGVRGCPAGHES
jgi:hypothetical protein